jgi:hypothetical protein
MRPVHLPVLAFPIRRQDKRSFSRSNQNSYSTHSFLLDFVIVLVLVIVIDRNRIRRGISNRGWRG